MKEKQYSKLIKFTTLVAKKVQMHFSCKKIPRIHDRKTIFQTNYIYDFSCKKSSVAVQLQKNSKYT